MKPFMNEDFLLTTDTARALYHDCAESMPIYDYHCHLNPNEIVENVRFRNVGHLMLGGDHYKWRAMLSNGAPESALYGGLGGGSDWEQFLEYAKMLKYAIGNPLFHWTHLELKRVFGIDEVLNEKSAKAIWDECNRLLDTDAYRCRPLIEKFNVKLICTTDDPLDDLAPHAALAADASFPVTVLPAFRPDKALNMRKPGFADYIARLGAATGIAIRGVSDVAAALEARLDYFHERGARISDHGLDRVPSGDMSAAQLDAALARALAGGSVTPEEDGAYQKFLLVALGGMYEKRGWTMQLHMNAMRNNNARMFQKCGADHGFDSVDDALVAQPLSRLLDAIDQRGGLPKTILYSLNPCANYVIGTMLGNFQGGMPGKVQMGSGWWFCDQRDGMLDQLRTLANLGLLGRFVGMLTDSRSFISYPRHEYFRRILCELIGGWVENGEYPADMDALSEIVRGISYDNARNYFDIKLK